ncbi:DNA-processing protein DprA [Acetobacter sp. AN02]|uniref:DNA-processing protein DprA n=1 Tax=Acetobacter sp. AN02 TaxID=2894186 RepID=UPI0024341E69|nr:DNA-processing protein DprA [Acetobacter sp. AN02]MDG6095080.1 DNA-processing protein DprA [Acetobacter sp. AN02]
MRTELPALLRLARTENVGPVTWRRLMAHTGSAETALEAVPEFARRGGRKTSLRVPSLAETEGEIAAVEALGGRILTLRDPEYPPLLAEIPDSPPVISVLGNVSLLAQDGVAIVGARNASAAGMRIAESLATGLADAELVVVSGLARGIDGAAHRGALFCGRTAAAIAGGLDVVYPPDHAALQAEIAEKGVLVTEAPFGTQPQARHFPRRNRLIAGLSLGCVVIEAAVRSGSLITADLADRYSRMVFAVPGSPLDPRNTGSNGLLKKGSVLTETTEDILSFLPRRSRNTGFSEPVAAWNDSWSFPDHVRDTVLPLLSFTPVAVDDLARRCHFSVSVVLCVLTELELAGRAYILPGGRAVRAPDP